MSANYIYITYWVVGDSYDSFVEDASRIYMERDTSTRQWWLDKMNRYDIYVVDIRVYHAYTDDDRGTKIYDYVNQKI